MTEIADAEQRSSVFALRSLLLRFFLFSFRCAGVEVVHQLGAVQIINDAVRRTQTPSLH